MHVLEAKELVKLIVMLVVGFLAVTARVDARPTLDLEPTKPPTCKETLSLCDDYVNALEDEIKQREVLLTEQATQIGELKASQQETPWYYFVITGLFTGALIWEVAR